MFRMDFYGMKITLPFVPSQEGNLKNRFKPISTKLFCSKGGILGTFSIPFRQNFSVPIEIQEDVDANQNRNTYLTKSNNLIFKSLLSKGDVLIKSIYEK